MRSLKRAVAITLSAAMLTTAVAAPAAWAGDRHHSGSQGGWQQPRRSHDNTGALIGLGILGLATAAIVANASHAEPAPVYYAPPQPAYYPPQQTYYAPQPQPVYAQPCANYTTVNGAPACIYADGTWQYVR